MGGATAAASLDRRHVRRRETIEEVVAHALEIMAEEGVAGLSLGEIARRMGIRPPSLYVYFSSKNALYDEIFRRGWDALIAHMTAYNVQPQPGDDLATILAEESSRHARWSMDHRAFAQLMFWRPVPGFEPSPAAYQPAMRYYALILDRFRGLQELGLIRPDADAAAAMAQWTVIISGVVSQQLANAPDETFDHGRFTGQLPGLAAMFAAHYATPRGGSRRAPKTTPTTARRGHARTR